MSSLTRLLLFGYIAMSLISCGEIKDSKSSFTTSDVEQRDVASETLANRKVKLIIGQDLTSIRGYSQSKRFPKPAGVTTYLSFYKLLSQQFPEYGGLGLDHRGYATDKAVDWGAGPLNALALSNEYPDALLNIGLNIAEGTQSSVWMKDGLKGIASGKFDKEINHLAKFFKTIPNPVLLRIGYEFDGVWNRGYENQGNYIKAFRYIVDKLRAYKVTNVAYVWQASASPIDDLIEAKHETISDWYPGDGYVDWVGLSWFLAPDRSVGNVANQRRLADEVIKIARLKQKLVLIAEAAPQGYNLGSLSKSNISKILDGESGGNKRYLTHGQVWAEWFEPFFRFIHENGDVVRAVAYINADWDSQRLWSTPYQNGYWGDSRLQANPEIARRWSNEIADDTIWSW